jgi:hypothetical protein
MALETITIQLDSETAKAYNSAPAGEQRKMQALLRLWLRDLAAADCSTLKEIMSDVSKRAWARGLTSERLEALLKEA